MMAASGDPGGVAGADPGRLDRRTGLACGLLILGAFLALLDTTIVSVGMDRIGAVSYTHL